MYIQIKSRNIFRIKQRVDTFILSSQRNLRLVKDKTSTPEIPYMIIIIIKITLFTHLQYFVVMCQVKHSLHMLQMLISLMTCCCQQLVRRFLTRLLQWWIECMSVMKISINLLCNVWGNGNTCPCWWIWTYPLDRIHKSSSMHEDEEQFIISSCFNQSVTLTVKTVSWHSGYCVKTTNSWLFILSNIFY